MDLVGCAKDGRPTLPVDIDLNRRRPARHLSGFAFRWPRPARFGWARLLTPCRNSSPSFRDFTLGARADDALSLIHFWKCDRVSLMHEPTRDAQGFVSAPPFAHERCGSSKADRHKRPFHNPSLRTMISLGVLVLALLAGVQSMYAQGNATIVGVVSDSTKAAVAGAHVTLINEGTGIRATALSDSGGRYSFPQLAVGNYRVEVVSDGLQAGDCNPALT